MGVMAMRNVMAIFGSDMRALKRNLIAAIVAFGLAFVPPMYAWLTTLGFWDPYGETGNLQVAIANEDEGYSSSLIPTKINAGNEITAALHENHQFDWVFVNQEEAVDGVKAGKYYAAIVIPGDFSQKLMTVFSSHTEKPQIDYYANEKENAIAPRITNTGATELQVQISETFTRTVVDTALSLTAGLSEFLGESGIANYAAQLDDDLQSATENIDADVEQLRNLIAMVDVTRQIISSSASILGDTGGGVQASRSMMDEAAAALASAREATGGITDEVNAAIGVVSSDYDTISAAIDEVFDSLENDPAAAQALLASVNGEIGATMDLYRDVEEQLRGAGVDEGIVDEVGNVVTALGRLRSSLQEASGNLGSLGSDAQQAHERIRADLAEAKTGITAITSTLERTLDERIGTLSDQLDQALSSTGEIGERLDEVSGSLETASTDLVAALDTARDSLEETLVMVESTRDDLVAADEELREALADGDLNRIRAMIGDDPDSLATYLSAPTDLVEHPVYEMDNNGSSMSSFYTSLSLWIGAIFLVALTNTKVSRRRLDDLGLRNVKPWQLYFGRYGVFMVIAIAQGLIVCAGNVLFVGVQCENVPLYFLTGVLCAVVFSNIVYTLALSFGNVGKAIAIILLVMQIGGAGGIFPIQMAPPVFQAIYPWLPLTHSMGAFEGCIAGIYGMQYASSIGCLLAFLVPSLLLGLVLRKPVVKLNDMVTRNLESTDVLA